MIKRLAAALLALLMILQAVCAFAQVITVNAYEYPV